MDMCDNEIYEEQPTRITKITTAIATIIIMLLTSRWINKIFIKTTFMLFVVCVCDGWVGRALKGWVGDDDDKCVRQEIYIS